MMSGEMAEARNIAKERWWNGRASACATAITLRSSDRHWGPPSVVMAHLGPAPAPCWGRLDALQGLLAWSPAGGHPDICWRPDVGLPPGS